MRRLNIVLYRIHSLDVVFKNAFQSNSSQWYDRTNAIRFTKRNIFIEIPKDIYIWLSNGQGYVGMRKIMSKNSIKNYRKMVV